MKKVLFTATIDSHIHTFHIPYLKYFKQKGYEVHVATNDNTEMPFCDKKIVVPFARNLFKIKNIIALRQLQKIINYEKYDIIHTHTLIGSIITRIATRSPIKKYNTKVIYTTYGFPFYKGAPKKDWLIYYPIEKKLSRYTDDLITINKEDYELAKNKFHTNIHYIPGVGIESEKFDIKLSTFEQEKIRNLLGLKKDDFVIIYTAELNENKNQIMLIKAMKILVKKYPNIHLLLVGKDNYNGYYQNIVSKEKLNNNIHFLGYRTDIPKLLKISNLSVSSSLREGLPISIMEAMYVGLPIIGSNCRENRDLIKDNVNGFLIEPNDVDKFASTVEKIYKNKVNIDLIKENNKEKAKTYTLDNILKYYDNIYRKYEKANRIAYLRSTSIINESRSSKEVETYIENNYLLTILCWDRQQIIKKDEQLKEKANLILFNVKSGYGNGTKNIIKYTRFQLWLYHNLKKERNNYDVIHACDYDTAYIGYKIAKKYHKKLIYDIYDYYVSCHNLSYFKKIIEKKDINIINNADCVILCTEKRKEQINKAHPKNTIIIHNTPSLNIKPSTKKFDNQKIKICYVGILQDDRLLLEISEQLKNNKKFELHIGGFGKYEDYFKELSLKYKNIFFYGHMRYDDVLKLENKCDILFATYNPIIPNHKYSAPNKIYEAMALGKPIIVCSNTGVDEIVMREKIGYVINYSAEEFVKVLNNISITTYKKMAEKTQKIYHEKFTWDKMKEKLIHEIERM